MKKRNRVPWFKGKRRKFKDTYIELKIQRFLKVQGIPYKTQVHLPGIPDVFVEPNIAIFADGCFFHNCPQCFPGCRGRYRDKRITKKLQERGYVVLRFWEHDIHKNWKAVRMLILDEIRRSKK